MLGNIAIPFASSNLHGLVSNFTFKRKICGKETVRAGIRFSLFTLNEDANDIIKIIKSLEDSGVLIYAVNEKVRHEMEKEKGNFLELC